jgi:hypothetical protein
MPFTRALYYPSIDIKDETWLKNAMLYWEKIQTIVPSAMEFQYSTQTARKFHEADLLTPFYADLNRTIIDELTDCVMDYLQTPEGVEVIVPYEVESPYES